MDQEQIEVVISADGTVELKVSGVKGDKCTLITKPVEDALGGVVDRQKTSEYFEAENKTENKRQIGQ